MADPFARMRTSNVIKPITSTRPGLSRRDLDRGLIWRYFVARANLAHIEVVEVSSRDYETYDRNPTIICEKLRWIIRGPLDDDRLMLYTGRSDGEREEVIVPGVLSQNRASIEAASERLPALRNSITPTQYYLGV